MSEPFLDGVTVVEVSRGRAAAFCCRLLADWGAEVVKVEPPGGDLLRTEDGSLFERLNAGKKSVTLNTADEAGLALFRRIASYVEAVIEDDGTGLDYESLSAESGRLVVTSVLPSVEADALSKRAPAGREGSGTEPQPYRWAPRHGWEYVGLNAFGATLAALVGVTMTERGQHVIVDTGECLAAMAMLSSKPLKGARPAESVFRAPVLRPAKGIARPGEHNKEVLGEMLGLTGPELSALREKGLV